MTGDRDAGMRRKFDVDCGYAALNDASSAAMQRAISEDRFDLLEHGFEKVHALSEEDCAQIIAFMDVGGEALKRRDAKLQILERVLSGDIDQRIIAYFGSEYIPLWFRFYRAVPESNPNVSFRWHCDGGPSKHLKILLYLNAREEHGGDTLFVDRKTTDAFKRLDYVFCDINRRLEDLEPIAMENGIPYEPFSLAPSVGDALLFEPMNIMHRGSWPTNSPRDMIQVCLLPSPAPWREMCQVYDLPGESNDWPIVGGAWPAPRLDS